MPGRAHTGGPPNPGTPAIGPPAMSGGRSKPSGDALGAAVGVAEGATSGGAAVSGGEEGLRGSESRGGAR